MATHTNPQTTRSGHLTVRGSPRAATCTGSRRARAHQHAIRRAWPARRLGRSSRHGPHTGRLAERQVGVVKSRHRSTWTGAGDQPSLRALSAPRRRAAVPLRPGGAFVQDLTAVPLEYRSPCAMCLRTRGTFVRAQCSFRPTPASCPPSHRTSRCPRAEVPGRSARHGTRTALHRSTSRTHHPHRGTPAGELKKSMFTVMNYYMPTQACCRHFSANLGPAGDTALSSDSRNREDHASADSSRSLIVDDYTAGRRRRFQLRGWILSQGHNLRGGEPESPHHPMFGTILETSC